MRCITDLPPPGDASAFSLSVSALAQEGCGKLQMRHMPVSHLHKCSALQQSSLACNILS